MIIFLNTIKIVFLLGFLIFIHELGHFLIAKWFKITVIEFAIGFGPVIWKKQGKETRYVLRLIPLGGFVNLLGEEETSEDEGSYSIAPRWKKALILLAGGTVNIIFGLLIYFILVTSSGNYVSTTIDEVMDNSAAKSIGLQSGDTILIADNKKIRLKGDIDRVIAKGKEIKLIISRNNEILEYKVLPNKDEDTGRFFLGVLFKPAENNLRNNLYYGFWDTIGFGENIIVGIKDLFTGNVQIKQLAGPVGISGMVAKTSNFEQYIYIFAVISLSLGVTNLLPFPPLDGGKVFLLLIEAIIRKPIKENINNIIQLTGFFILMGLAVVVTYNDVLKIF